MANRDGQRLQPQTGSQKTGMRGSQVSQANEYIPGSLFFFFFVLLIIISLPS